MDWGKSYEDLGKILRSFENRAPGVPNHTTKTGMSGYNNNNNDRLTAFDPGQPG